MIIAQSVQNTVSLWSDGIMYENVLLSFVTIEAVEKTCAKW